MELKKNLTLIDVFSISTGAMISSGIFVLPGIAFKDIGPAVFISYLLAGVFALAGSLSTIELSTAMPKAGGDYYFIERSMGPMAGTISGFLSWFALSLKSSFAILGLAEVVFLIFGFNPVIAAIAFTIFFVGLNIIGVKEAAWLEVTLVVGLLVILGLFILFGLPKVSMLRFEPFVADNKGFSDIIAAAGLVFVSFGGLLKVASVSEEVDKPRRNIPLGMISSIIVVTVCYTLIMIVTVGAFDGGKLSTSLAPLADVARLYYGSPGYWLLTAAAVFAFVTTANAGIMAASRYPLALSRDKLIPKGISKVSGRSQTPVLSLIITGAFIIISLLLEIKTLAKAASTVILTSYVLSNFAVIILRESRLQNYRPSFKAPLYPWLQIISILLFSSMIFGMGLEALQVACCVIVISLIVYLIYGKRTNKEYALLHLIGRITNKQLTSHTLEGELLNILHRRDDVVKDDFDLLVEAAPVVIIEDRISLEELFEKIADNFSSEVGLTIDEMKKLLREREDDTSTAISPLVAIPHLIAEGEDIFKIFIAKCSKGVKFSDENDSVKAVFVIIGTRDQRNRHLKALAAIAQVIQDRQFEERWDNANDAIHIRDLILLCKRKRFS